MTGGTGIARCLFALNCPTCPTRPAVGSRFEREGVDEYPRGQSRRHERAREDIRLGELGDPDLPVPLDPDPVSNGATARGAASASPV